jgi:uncharacterized protein (TIGR02001 family)
MIKKTLLAGAVAAALVPFSASAADAPSPHTITGNIGFFNQYIFRGLNQTDKEPALQGGLDYSHASGFYLGTWGSNVSVLRDSGAYSAGGSLEWDFYGGYKNSIGKTDFGYDVGLLYYWYPGTVAPGGTKADTLEIYGALSWKWLSAKLSYAISDEVFGVRNADGSYYLDLTATFPLGKTGLTLIGHYGIQKFEGSNAGVDNDSSFSYNDYKIGVSYALPKDFTVGAYFTDTDAEKAFYTTPAAAGSRFLGKEAFTFFVQKTF